MKKDIKNKEDIQLLINNFYKKVIDDDEIGFIFNDVMKVNWKNHLPIMYDFWENNLFYTGAYEGNPMESHKKLNTIVPLTSAHFDRWNTLFNNAVDENFEGEKADLAKQRAYSISTVMKIKILSA